MANNRIRSYCFTDFECNIGWWERYYNQKGVTYLIMGEEICPKSKKKHFQGWLRFKNGRTWNSVQKDLAPRHVEVMNGDSESNEKYCRKDGKIILELGKKPEPGERTDMEDLKDMIVQRKSERAIFEVQPGNYIRYNRGIERARSLFAEKRNWEMDVRIYWGPPGSGKTRSVYEEFGENVYQKMNGKWWDGYAGETCVVIDDFDPENCFDITYDFYLKLLDRYPLRVETKGSSVQFCSKVIIITSNFDPTGWFPHKKNRSAFFRRVKKIVPLPSGDGTEVVG